MRGVPMVSSEDSAWDVPPSIFGTRAGGPTVQRLVLGSQLHRLRESRGITAEQAAEAIRGSHSKISRMEHGRVGFKERDVADLLTLYGVADAEERAALLNLAREANTPGWWHAYSDVLSAWLEPDVADVVYIEQLTRALYLDKPAEVDSYLEIMSQLCLRAESAADTTKLLQQILSDI